MKLGIVGLGRMGSGLTERLLRGGHNVVVYNRSEGPVKAAAEKGALPADSLQDLVSKLSVPRILWSMVPAGHATEEVLNEAATCMERGDILIDGGNSNYRDSIRHSKELGSRGIRFLDIGTSGGIWGLEAGYCLMVGGDAQAVKTIEPALRTLAPKDGYLHVGPSGAGHFTKMVHNGIEYGLMQSYAEGFELLQASPFKPDLKAVANLWNHGSVVRSWLLELMEEALKKDPELGGLDAYVEDSGEGRWTVMEAVQSGVPTPVIAASLFQRFYSREKDAFAMRVLAALRREFGGHTVHTPKTTAIVPGKAKAPSSKSGSRKRS